MRRYLTPFSTNNTEVRDTDVLIVGAGLAGLFTAFHIAQDKHCTVLLKNDVSCSNSWLAQGGIAAVISPDDTVESHVSDTLKAGAGLCDEEAVRVLVSESGDAIRELVSLGVPFDRKADGSLSITREGGHSCRRIVHCGGDATGREATRRLAQIELARKNTDFLFNAYLTDILTNDGRICGALISLAGKPILFRTPNVVICTGGIGYNYKHTTNPRGATGDGMAAAERAGAQLAMMEMVQFHPTTLIAEENAQRLFLISEAVRGEGAILRNHKGEAFMQGVHELKDLAPRDIVTRAILAELQKNPYRNVFLDVSSMTRAFFAQRFPTIYAKCRESGIQLTEDQIPVRPAQHYQMGGIKTGLNGETCIDGLYAVGEAACTGIHGGNRLASNSMLECLVFGKRAALCINADKRRAADISLTLSYTEPDLPPLTKSEAKEMRDTHREIMQSHVGAVRHTALLSEALSHFESDLALLDSRRLDAPYAFEIYNMTEIAIAVTSGALARKESVGAHYIVD